MRRLLCFASYCCLLASLAVTPLRAADEIAWHSDLEEAFEVARETNRPLLLHFWTPDCIPCRRLEKNVLNQPRVVETLEKQFVPVKINAQEFPQLAARYHVSSVPKDVILNTRDEELLRLFTPQDPDQYVAQLSAVVLRSGGASPEARGARPASASSRERSAAATVARRATKATAPPEDSERGEDSRAAAAPVEAEEEKRFPSAVRSPREVINRFAAKNRGASEMRRETTEDADEATAATNPEAETIPQPASGPLEKTAAVDSPVPTRNDSRQSDRPPVDRTSAATDESLEQPSELATKAVDAEESQVASRHEPAPAASSSTSQEAARDSLGLEGYCPVTLIRGNAWKKGDASFGAIHRGKVYRFAGAAEKETFLADPDAFSPILAGLDPVELAERGEAVEGRRDFGLVYHDRVYMFISEENLQTFQQQPTRFTRPIEQAMETGDLNVFRR